MSKHINANELKEKCEGRWVEIISALCPDLAEVVKHPNRHYPCPCHESKKKRGDGLRALKMVADTGATVCNTCGKHPDGFSTISWYTGWSFRQTLEEVDNYLGGLRYSTAPVHVVKPSFDHTPERDAQIRASLKKLWATGVSLDHPSAEPARRHFQRRGLPLPKCNVRFHPGLYYRTEDGESLGKFPGFIALITGKDDLPVTLHRTFLTPDGRKLSEVHPKVLDSRKMMSIPNGRKLEGAAIRLTPLNSHEMGVGEGTETAEAGEILFKVPTWATVNRWMLEEFEPPEGITHVHIFADKDANGDGQASADKLAERLRAKGITVTIHLPPLPIPEGKSGVDWNDVLLDQIRKAA